MESEQPKQPKKWIRWLAIHEAGHAVLAYLWGANFIEIGLSDDSRTVTFKGGETAEDCGAACLHNLYRQGEITPDHMAMLSTMMAGTVAESRFTGSELFGKSGRGDKRDISEAMELIKKSTGNGDDYCQRVYSRALAACKGIVDLYWGDIVALADLAEKKNMTEHPEIVNFLNSRPEISGAKIYQVLGKLGSERAA